MIDWDKPVRIINDHDKIEVLTTKGRGNNPVITYIGDDIFDTVLTIDGRMAVGCVIAVENYTPTPFWYEGMLVLVSMRHDDPYYECNLFSIENGMAWCGEEGSMWDNWIRHPDEPWHPMSDPMPADKAVIIATEDGWQLVEINPNPDFLKSKKAVAWRLPETHTFHTGDV